MKPFKPQWFWITRTLGTIMILYELVIDTGSERITIIMAAMALMGVEAVSKHEDPKKDGG